MIRVSLPFYLWVGLMAAFYLLGIATGPAIRKWRSSRKVRY